jgi:hypothetical protein
MSDETFENIKSDVLPYDFVKENEVIALHTKEGVIVSSQNISLKKSITRFKDF